MKSAFYYCLKLILKNNTHPCHVISLLVYIIYSIFRFSTFWEQSSGMESYEIGMLFRGNLEVVDNFGHTWIGIRNFKIISDDF